jgi:hypothetical protein
MAKSVDTITKKKVTRKSVKTIAKKPTQRARTTAAPAAPAPIPAPVRTPAKRIAATPKPVPPAAPTAFEHRRKYMAPLVVGSLVVIVMLWAAFGAAMHPRQAGDTFFASFAKNFNVTSIKTGWDRALNRGTEEERAIRKAQKEIFPQFEVIVNTN